MRGGTFTVTFSLRLHRSIVAHDVQRARGVVQIDTQQLPFTRGWNCRIGGPEVQPFALSGEGEGKT